MVMRKVNVVTHKVNVRWDYMVRGLALDQVATHAKRLFEAVERLESLVEFRTSDDVTEIKAKAEMEVRDDIHKTTVFVTLLQRNVQVSIDCLSHHTVQFPSDGGGLVFKASENFHVYFECKPE